MAAMKRFYVDLLGFAVEWEPDPDNVYLSSGIDNLALNRSTSLTTGRSAEGGPAGPPLHDGGADPRVGPAALDHLGLIVREADDVDRWAVFLEGNGVAMSAKPKTHRDGARSCYFKDPD